MKIKKMAGIAAAAAALLTLASCEPVENVLAYSQTEVCTIVGNRLLTDSGYYFNIVKNQIADAKPVTSFKRAVVYCDILNYTEGKTDEFDINLIDATEVTVTDIVMQSTADQEALGDDAVGLHSAWLSKDYLNVDASYTAFASSSLKHDLALVMDDVKSNSDTVYLTLRHNAHGESYDKTTLVSGVDVIGQYFSYPIGQVIPEGSDSIVLCFTWDWFKSINGTLVKDRETSSGCLSWKKE